MLSQIIVNSYRNLRLYIFRSVRTLSQSFCIVCLSINTVGICVTFPLGTRYPYCMASVFIQQMVHLVFIIDITVEISPFLFCLLKKSNVVYCRQYTQRQLFSSFRLQDVLFIAILPKRDIDNNIILFLFYCTT